MLKLEVVEGNWCVTGVVGIRGDCSGDPDRAVEVEAKNTNTYTYTKNL